MTPSLGPDNPPSEDSRAFLGMADCLSEEKIWFVYFGDRHHGPFSEREIGNWARGGRVGPSTLVWSARLPEWTALENVPEFKEAPFGTSVFSHELEVSEFFEFQEQPSSEVCSGERPSTTSFSSQRSSTLPFVPALARKEVTALPGEQPTIAKRVLSLKTYALAALTLGAALFMCLRPVSISPIAGVSELENADLQMASATSLRLHGPRAAVALGQAGEALQRVYVATNLPNRTELSLRLEAEPATLVDRFRAVYQTNLKVKDGLVQSELKDNEGRAFPVGEYWVSVTCAKCEHPQETLVHKKYLFGVSDAGEYRLKLLAYHKRLREQSEEELTEIKQMAATLEGQLNETVEQYEKIRNRRVPASRKLKDWQSFDLAWQKLELQLDSVFKTWEDELSSPGGGAQGLATGKFYQSQLYLLLSRAGQLTHGLHAKQGEQIERGQTLLGSEAQKIGAKSDQDLEVEIASEVSVAQSALLSLHAKQTLIERMPAAKDGMPPRADR